MYSRTEEILREALIEAKGKIEEQNEILQQLLALPTTRGYVVSIDRNKALVSLPGLGLRELIIPTQPINDKSIGHLIKPGIIVRVISENQVLSIVDVLDVKNNTTGNIFLTTKEGKNAQCEIDCQGTPRTISYDVSVKAPEIGDRLLVDAECHVVIKNMGPDETKFSFQGETGVTWDQVGGLHAAKATLKEAIEMPFMYSHLYKKYNKKPVKGVLLYGPPGCGKTLLAKAVATAVCNIHNAKPTETGFIYVKGPELLDKYVGNSEAMIRSLFARARKHKQKHGYQAVIFIDEADAILGKRGGRPHLGMEATTVPQFLAEMDGLDDTGAFVLLATNRPNSLDSAVTRDGRIDHKVQVTRPDQSQATDIFELYLKNQPIHQLSVREMAERAAAYLYGDSYVMYNLHTQSGAIDFTLGNMVNGAMIAGMVDKASTLALRREIAGSDKSGISLDDLQEAALDIFKQNQHLNHEEEVKEFIDLNTLQIDQITKASLNA